MGRALGIVLLLATLLAGAGLRLLESRRADALLAGESRARATMEALVQASLPITRRGDGHPGLRGAVLDAATGLVAWPDLGTAEISYAHDDVYAYGLATRSRRDAPDGPLVQGWVLRCWPLRFGVTGDVEYHASEDGRLWEGQNRLGRSGIERGFPPPFPDPELDLPKGPWRPAPPTDHM